MDLKTTLSTIFSRLDMQYEGLEQIRAQSNTLADLTLAYKQSLDQNKKELMALVDSEKKRKNDLTGFIEEMELFKKATRENLKKLQNDGKNLKNELHSLTQSKKTFENSLEKVQKKITKYNPKIIVSDLNKFKELNQSQIKNFNKRMDILEKSKKSILKVEEDINTKIAKSEKVLRENEFALSSQLAKHFEVFGGRFDRLEGRFDGIEGRFDRLEERFDNLESNVNSLKVNVKSLQTTVEKVENSLLVVGLLK